MEQMKNPRRFSLNDDFMKYDTDDLVYGFMRSISTAKPEGEGKYKEYLTIKKFQEEKKTIAGICGTTAKTITNRLNKLIERGLVEEGHVMVKKKSGMEEVPCYFFPYDYDGIYKIIEQEMVGYLVSTRNSQAIRIYLYLLNCSSLKNDYVFTIRGIKKALGYSETTKSIDSVINNVLNSFQKEGIISFTKEQFDCVSDRGGETKTIRMVLKFIATNMRQF